MASIFRANGTRPISSSSKNKSHDDERHRGIYGAEDEIWTRATITDATPLAGEPLEPLGYFCLAQTLYYYTTIFSPCQSIFAQKNKIVCTFFTDALKMGRYIKKFRKNIIKIV